MKEKSSPKATKRQDKVDNAENTGENNVDLKSTPTPTQRPQNTEVAAAPKPAEEAQGYPDEQRQGDPEGADGSPAAGRRACADA